MAYGLTKSNLFEGTPRLLLKSARRSMNLSIRQLAALSGYGDGYLSSLESGNFEMNTALMKRLSNVLMIKNPLDVAERFTFKKQGDSNVFIGEFGTIIPISSILDDVK